MLPKLSLFLVFAWFVAILSPVCAQDSQATSEKASTPQNSAQTLTPADPTSTKKTKKVWTNENLSDATGSISVVGDPKKVTKGKNDSTSPNSTYIAETRKKLEKLNSQLADTEKQLADLKNFSQGEPSGTPGRQLHKGYNTDPIPEQIQKLEDKKKDLNTKIDALLDEARKKGVLPGQLR